MKTKAVPFSVLALAVVCFYAVSYAADQPRAKPAGAKPKAAAGDAKDGAFYFASDVMPLLTREGCNLSECHGSGGGQGGFKLSMFGAEPDLDFEALTKWTKARRINKVEPQKSLFLLKATASVPHEGGQKIEVGSPEYQMLVSWVAQGAPWKGENVPELASIRVAPEEQMLKKGESHQFKVTAVFSDNSQRDVTRDAVYSSSQEEVAVADNGGNVTAAGFGQATIVVSYMLRFAAVRIIVPQPLPSGFPEVKPNNKIDGLVFAKLKQLGIPPSDLCSDEEFLRRAYLDVIGTLPTSDEARAFLSDSDAQKRGKLIDRLLASEEFADFWALKWGDLMRVKAEYPSNLWPNAVQAYHHWIRHSIATNKPYDQFARELITASGSNFRVPPANYYRAFLKREPQSLAEVTALVFMGARVGCARCHAHPAESWTLDDNVGLAAFFAQVRYKPTREWKEEIVYVNPLQTMRHPRTNEVVQPKILGGEVVEPAQGEDLRARFAAWLTAPENPWFARNIVNRVWFWLLGRGIVHEPDDLRSTNPPQNPELLDYLAKELVSHNYDLKHIYRLILSSRTYQLSSKSNEWNQNDVAHFSHYYVKRLGAETLLDAIGQVTERWDTYRSTIPEPFVVMPAGFRATHLPDGSVGLPFLELFGRPPRDTAFESDRDLELSMRQTLHLLNSSDVQNKINASPRLRQLMTEVKEDSRIIEELYLSTVSRFPTEEDKKRIAGYFSGEGKSIPQDVLAAQKAAQEALAKIDGGLAKASAEYEAAEKAAKEAETVAAQAKAAATQAATAQANAEKAAAAKRQQANGAKKKADDLVQNSQKPAEARLAAAAKLVTDATNAKAAVDQALAGASDAVAGAEQAYEAAEKAAKEAEAKAKEISQDESKSEEEKKQAAGEAAAKRKAADEAKAAVAQAQQKQQQAQTQANAASKKLAEAEAQKKSAEQALTNVKSQVAAAGQAYQAAEKAAKQAETAAVAAKTQAGQARTAQAAADKAAAEKRKPAGEAKARRDKLAADQKAATAKLADATRKVDAAKAALRPRRDQAIQDLLWALLNTKEFVFNH